MEFDEYALRDACFKYAQEVYLERKPTDLALIQNFADQVFEDAVFHKDYLKDSGRDPNSITACVLYLRRHAIPPLKDNIQFVSYALDVLVELVSPNSGTDADDLRFFEELKLGIEEAENDLRAISAT